jgi:5'-phosphate synthase pdxT subunit
VLKVGILALQGAVEAHALKLRTLGAEVVEVRTPEALRGLSGIILPGGESTTMLHLLKLNHLFEPLKAFVQEKPAWGVCAGMILLADTVTHPIQESLHAIAVEVARNGFGRQVDSFIGPVEPTPEFTLSEGKPVEGVFIRAPRVQKWAPDVKVLLKWHDEPVMLQKGRTLVSSFHPELTRSLLVHQYFINLCRA